MAKYVMEFSKTGTICYTSHLDIMRLFKRIFKRADVALAYSQGFNPHPKMGFAQPLSLGYEALEEYIEFETKEEMEADEICTRVRSIMPEGIDIKYCRPLEVKKTLSALTVAAAYEARIPLEEGHGAMDGASLAEGYLSQEAILTLKKQKKKKELKEVDIRPMIQHFAVREEGPELVLEMILDQGSTSNLSPELVLQTFQAYAGLTVPRSDIHVCRQKLYFAEGTEL